MIIEALLEQSIIDALQSELGDDVQLVGSRLETKNEDADKKTIVAVASAFRNHDAFSLSLINVPVAISVATRVEGDAQSQEHNATVEKIVDLLVGWHKDGEAMSDALTNRKFLAGELRMDGGTTQTFDRERMIWTDAININIRGAEKFLPPPTVVTYLDGTTEEFDILGTMDYSWSTGLDKANVKSVRIGDGVTYLGDGAFSGFTSLAQVTVPAQVENISSFAFTYSQVIVADFLERTMAQVKGMTNYHWGIARGSTIHCTDGDILIGGETRVTYVGSATPTYLDIVGEMTQSSIPNLQNVSTVEVGLNVTSIASNMFKNCTNLTRCYLPPIARIPASMFDGCYNLADVQIAEGTTVIMAFAFRGCTSLTTLNLPTTLVDVLGQVFVDCQFLRSLDFAPALRSIGYNAFGGCTSLTNVNFQGKTKYQLTQMLNYSWGITDTNIITVS